MKRLFTFLSLALGMVAGVSAQTASSYKVASTATTFENLTTGTYMIRVLSNKNSKTNYWNGSTAGADDNGRFVYLSGSSVAVDSKTLTTNNFEGTTVTYADKSAYLWTVTKNSDNTISVQALSDESKKWILGYQSFSLGSSASSGQTTCFTAQTSSMSPFEGWYYFYGATSTANTYIGHSGGGGLEGWDYSGDNVAIAHFKFFAATDLSTITTHTVTYEYYLDGVKKGTSTATVDGGEAYPAPTLPDYVSGATPSGTVTADVTQRIDCTYDGPVVSGKPYFINFAFANTANENGYGYLYENNGGQLALGTTTKNLDSKKGVWIFEGDQFTGWTVKSAANSYKWYTTAITADAGSNAIQTSSLSVSGRYENFELKKPSASSATGQGGGFLMRVKDSTTDTKNWWVNARDGHVGFWLYSGDGKDDDGGYTRVYADNGSGIKVEDALPSITLNTADNVDYYATYYLPFAAKAPEGVTAYAVKKNGVRAEMTEFADGVIPANTGALIKGTSASATFTLSESEGTSQDNDLTGTLTAKTDFTASSVYIFSKKGSVVGFYHPASSTTTLAANKAYVEATDADADVEGFAIGFTPVTGIASATAAEGTAKAPVYDLSGRRVANPVKGGVYIQGGRKMIVK